jgi:hypothetical protein
VAFDGGAGGGEEEEWRWHCGGGWEMIPGSDPSSFSPFCLSVFLFFFFPSFLSLFLFLLSFVFFQLSKQSSSLILSSLPGFLLKISFCFFLTPKTLLSNSPRLFFFFRFF